jgi:uncharacterized protein YcfL
MRRAKFLFLILFLKVLGCKSHNPNGFKFIRDLPDYINGNSIELQGLSVSRDSLKLNTLEKWI